MKFNANKDKTVDAIGPVNVMKAAARTVLEYPNFRFTLLGKDKQTGAATGSKRDDIIKEIGIIEKKVQIPSLLVPEAAYKRGVTVSLPKGQHAFLKCADKKSSEKGSKSKSKEQDIFVTDDKKKDPDPITMHALKPDDEKNTSEDENKKIVKVAAEKDKKEEKDGKEKEDKEAKEKQKSEEKKDDKKDEKDVKTKEKEEKDDKEKSAEKGKKDDEKKEAAKVDDKGKEKEDDKKKNAEQEASEDKKGEKNSDTESSEEAAFTSNIGNTEFELKLPENIESYTSEKGGQASNATFDGDSGEKKHTAATTNGQSSQTTATKPESFSQGFSDAKVFEKALTEEGEKASNDDQLKRQLLSLFDKDMMVSLYKMAIKDLMGELGLRSSNKLESVTSIRGKINGLQKQQVELEHHYPGITRSLVSYNKYLPKIQGYLNKITVGDEDETTNDVTSQIGKRSKTAVPELRKLIEELKKRDFDDEKSYYQVDESSSNDDPSYDDCVDETCRHQKQMIKTAHEYFGSLDALAMKPYEKFYKGEEPASNHVHKGIKRSSKKSMFVKTRRPTPEDDEEENALLRDTLFKALTQASGVENPEAIVQLAGKLPKVPVRITLNPRGPLAKLRRPIQIDLRPSSEEDASPEIVARTSPGVSVSVPKSIYQDSEDERHDINKDAYADIKRDKVPHAKRTMIGNRRGKKRGFHKWAQKGRLHKKVKARHHINQKIQRKHHHKKVKVGKKSVKNRPFPVIKENTMSAGLNNPDDTPSAIAENGQGHSDVKTEVNGPKDPYTEIGMFSILAKSLPT